MEKFNATYLSEAEAARFLGVLPRTLREWRKRRGLPFIRVTGKVTRYKRSDLEQWLERRREVRM